MCGEIISNIFAFQMRLLISSKNSSKETRQIDRCAEATHEETTRVEEETEEGGAVEEGGTEEEDVAGDRDCTQAHLMVRLSVAIIMLSTKHLALAS